MASVIQRTNEQFGILRNSVVAELAYLIFAVVRDTRYMNYADRIKDQEKVFDTERDTLYINLKLERQRVAILEKTLSSYFKNLKKK